jgi:putative membrane protein
MNATLRSLLRFLFSAIGLLVASSLVPGIQRGSFLELVAVAVLLGALNATLGLLLKRVAIVPMVCSFGCLSLFINGLVFWLAGTIAARLGLGFTVHGFWAGFFGALLTSVVATLLEWILIGKERKAVPPPPNPRIKIVN